MPVLKSAPTMGNTEIAASSGAGVNPKISAMAPLLASSLVLSFWMYLAFLRHTSHSALTACLTLGVVVLLMSGVRELLIRRLGAAGTVADELKVTLARSFCAVFLLVLFFPDYLLSHSIPTIRSVICLSMTLVVTALLIWLTCRHALGRRSMELPRARSRAIATGLLILGLCTAIAVWKYRVFGYVGQDLAYFSQIMYTTLKGHLFWGTLLQDLIYSSPVKTDFAGHNSPVMFLLLPFYWIVPSPITLLVLRNLLMASAAVPVWLIARRYFSPAASWLWTLVYLLTPAIFFQSSFDFYPLSLACVWIAWVVYFYLREDFIAFCVAMGVTLLVREDLVFLVFGLGVLAALHRRGPRWIVVPLVSSTVWGAFSFLFVIPHFLHGAHFVTDVCFSHLGKTPAGMVRQVLFHPTANVLLHDNIVYLKNLLTPAALMLLSPFSLLSLPYIGINLLAGSGRCITNVIFAQYSAIPAMTLFLGALVGIAKLSKHGRLQSWVRFGLPFDSATPLVMVAVCLISMAFVTDPPQIRDLKQHSWDNEARRVAAMIPSGAAVAAPRYMLPLLANRDYLYQTHRLLEYHTASYQYLIVDLDWSRIVASQDYKQEYAQVMARAEADPTLSLLYSSANYRVYRRERGTEIQK